MNAVRTERLVLRELTLNDAEFILELLNEAAFLRFIGDKGVRTLADARGYILKGPMDSYGRHGFGLLAACLPDVEAASAVLTHAKRVLHIQRIAAITSPENLGSIAVLEKIGLKFERMIRLAEDSAELKLYGLAQPADPL
jgi:RimJ/RimL family protein N-acetyltransferase